MRPSSFFFLFLQKNLFTKSFFPMNVSANLFKRYLWLANTIINAKHITRDEINQKWSSATLNENGESNIPQKTFSRHKEAIEDIFGITIQFRKSDNTYFIEDDLETDKVKKWILNSFSVYNLLQENYKSKDIVLFENIPSGTEFLLTILSAIKENHILHIEYQKFKDTQPSTFEAIPLCLKVDKQRWYVLTQKLGETKKKTYALDRIKNISITDQVFSYPTDFSPSAYFQNSFGIYTNEEEKIERVVLKANKEQSNYLRTLPLHHTQTETPYDNYSLFEYQLKLDKEFEMELMKLGPNIEVIAPKVLRDHIIEKAKETLEIYGKDA